MKIVYYETDDILYIKLNDKKIVKEVSESWNVNLAYSETGLSQITVLDAKKIGYWPIENLNDLMPMAR